MCAALHESEREASEASGALGAAREEVSVAEDIYMQERKLKAKAVQEKMERLDEQLTEARAVYESELSSSQHAAMAVRSYQAQEASPAEVDLTPLLKEALDNLWNRPYDCRVFTLQLLQVIPVTSP